jgi:hypothetical protein
MEYVRFTYYVSRRRRTVSLMVHADFLVQLSLGCLIGAGILGRARDGTWWVYMVGMTRAAYRWAIRHFLDEEGRVLIPC